MTSPRLGLPTRFPRFGFPSLAGPWPAGTSRRRAARAVTAGVAAVVALNLGLGVTSELYPRIRDPFYGDKLAKLRPRLHGRPLVLMLGSSRTGFGFHGKRAEAAVGHAIVAFNFGVPASGPVTYVTYLRRLLADGVTPDLLLVEVLPPMLADDPGGPRERLWLHGDRLKFHEVAAVEGYGFPADDVRPRWRAATLVPWHALRFQLLARVVPSWVPWQMRYDWSRGVDECGWGTPVKGVVTPAERAAGVAQAKAEYAAVLADLRPGGGAAAALRDLLAICRDRGIPVRLVRMPEGAEFRSWYPPAVEARLAAFLGGLCAEYGARLIDARGWVPEEGFADAHHLLRPGAEVFSDRLAADVIAPWREANR